MMLFMFGAMLLVLASGTFAAELYVAVEGRDSNPGTKAAPFASQARARDAIRQLKAAGSLPGPVTVFVRQGTYCLPETLTLGAEDSGTQEAPIVYQAYGGEKPVLLGGKPITGFVPHEGEILKAEVGSQGFKGVYFRLLVFEGRRQELARYPNRDPKDMHGGAWAYVEGKRINMYQDMPDESDYHQQHQDLDFWQRNVPERMRTLRVKPEDIHEWSRPEEGEVLVFPRFNWSSNMLPVESFDREGRLFTLRESASYEIRPGDRYFLRNLFEELDSPGEWYLDRSTWTLYFWPPEPVAGKAVYAPTMRTIIQMNGATHVTFRGFTLEYCDGTAVVLNDCTSCLIAGNTIRNAGDFDGSGVAVYGGRNNGVVGNDISEVGAYGIYLGGGDVISLTLAGNFVDNNYLHHVGIVCQHAKAVQVAGAGNRVSHNLIHDIPGSGIYMWGSKHVIEFNHIRHTCLESEDTGAIGGGAIDWLSWQGVVIRHNYIHDTIGFGYDSEAGQWRSPYFTSIVYPDWAASGVQIMGNILVRAPWSCLLLHSGRDNVVENNIFVDGAQSQVDCYGWTTDTGFWRTMVKRWIEKYESAVKHAAWRKVPTLKDPRKVPLPDGRVMYGNVFRRNIFYYRNPDAELVRFRNLPLELNRSDYNLVYHFGLPLRTGQSVLKAERGPNLLLNPGLEEGPVGRWPKDWGWLEKASEETRAVVVEDQAHSGRRCLLVDPGPQAAKENVVKQVHVAPASVPFRAGKAYRFTVWLKGESKAARVHLTALTWKKDAHYWSAATTVEVTDQWQQCELLFRLPKEGESAYKPTMEVLSCRLDLPSNAGKFWVDDLALREGEMSDEWEGWQARGQDQHSKVADPLFVDAEHDDYRLRPESPAFKLGFKPIPFEKIGPYEDPLRASWPIIEAEGARERLASR